MANRTAAVFGMEKVGGRTLKVARWNWERVGQAPPLLFFNGIGTNCETVAPLAEALSERPFITFDMPGIGGSLDPIMPYNPVTIACLADAVMERFGLAEADVMGVSWGGGIAQQMALQNPARVRRLVLAATNAGVVMVPGPATATVALFDPRRLTDPDFMAGGFKAVYGDIVGRDQAHLARFKAPSAIGYAYQLLAMAGWTSAPFLPLLRPPTLVLSGDADDIVPLANAHLLHSLIPGSKLEIVRGGGHMFLLSHGPETVQLLRNFLDAADTGERVAA